MKRVLLLAVVLLGLVATAVMSAVGFVLGSEGRSRKILAARLLEQYKNGQPDVLTVVVSAHGFADLLERAEFISRIQSQDTRIITNVRTTKRGAESATRTFTKLEQQQQRVNAGIAAQRNAAAALAEAAARKHAALEEARAAKEQALKAKQGERKQLEAKLVKLEKEQTPSKAALKPTAGWAIPWPIVECESGGQNTPPNSAGASGYYQIIPSTWKGYGGSGPAAYLAPKAEQDRVAAKIWDGGRGATQWDCYAMVTGT